MELFQLEVSVYLYYSFTLFCAIVKKKNRKEILIKHYVSTR